MQPSRLVQTRAHMVSRVHLRSMSGGDMCSLILDSRPRAKGVPLAAYKCNCARGEYHNHQIHRPSYFRTAFNRSCGRTLVCNATMGDNDFKKGEKVAWSYMGKDVPGVVKVRLYNFS